MIKKVWHTLRQTKAVGGIRSLIPHQAVNMLYHLPQAVLAVLWYRYPAQKLKVIGVTGTDGKTTTSTLIYNILNQAGLKTALISTVSAKIGDKELPTGLHVTSPSPWELQRLLRLIANKGFKYVVLESTSHGLAQYRLLGANFYIGVLTNITHEHLDYHKNLDNYFRDKAKLFKKTKFSVLNNQDSSFTKMKKLASGVVVTYGLEEADYTPKTFPLKPQLLGKFNLLNCLAASATARILQVDPEVIKKSIAGFSGVVGRMEEISMGQDFRVFVDFAHTINGLEQALLTLKKLPHKNLIAVFGCAGLRDFSKRPLMGKVACQYADKIVLTAEDPRTENTLKIIEQISSGCSPKKKLYHEPDRQKAIDLAIIKLAGKNDIVGIFGKGHEQSLCIGHVEYPWSDQKAVKKALKQKLKKK